MHNPARLDKIYGTLAQKGDASPDRPHRRAQLLKVADDLTPVPRELLEHLASFVPEEPRPTKKQYKSGPRAFNIDEWITKHALDVQGPIPWQGGRKWIFPVCPWNSAHTNRSAFILELSNGALSAGCHHNGCQGRDWHALRDLFEPGWKDRRKQSPNGHAGMSGAPPEPEWGGEQPHPSGDPGATGDTSQPKTGEEEVIPFDLFGDVRLMGEPDFPLSALPPVIGKFAKDTADRMGCDPAMVALPALAVAAVVINDRIKVQPKQYDTGWQESARLWTAIIHKPGQKHTPALTAALAPIEEIQGSWRIEDTEKLVLQRDFNVC